MLLKLVNVQRKNTPEIMNDGIWCELIVCALHRYGSCVLSGYCTWSIALELHAILVGNVADWSFHIMGSSAVFKRIHWVHITVHILFDNMSYQIFAQCPENISYFPQNFPGFPIPGKISRFPEYICFSPETALVIAVTPRLPCHSLGE